MSRRSPSKSSSVSRRRSDSPRRDKDQKYNNKNGYKNDLNQSPLRKKEMNNNQQNSGNNKNFDKSPTRKSRSKSRGSDRSMELKNYGKNK